MTRRRRITIGVLLSTVLASCASVPEPVVTPEFDLEPLSAPARDTEILEPPVAGASERAEAAETDRNPAPRAGDALERRPSPLATFTPENPLEDAITRIEAPLRGEPVRYAEPALPALPAIAAAPEADTAEDAGTIDAAEPADEAAQAAPAAQAGVSTPPEASAAAASDDVAAEPASAAASAPAADATRVAEPPRPPAASPVRPEPPAAAPEPERAPGDERVEVAVTQNFTIELPGENWIFLPDEESAVTLRARNRVNGSTIFEFVPDRAGEFSFSLQQQHMVTGDIRHHVVDVVAHDTPDGEATGVATPEPADGDGTDVAAADGVDIADGIAAVDGADAADGGDDDLETGDGAEVDISLDLPDSASAFPETPEQMLQTARRLRTERQFTAAYDLLNRWFELYAGHRGTDIAHFLTGMILVESPELRNVRSGMSHLAIVRADFPRSEVFHEADAEYRRLQRHFVQVR